MSCGDSSRWRTNGRTAAVRVTTAAPAVGHTPCTRTRPERPGSRPERSSRGRQRRRLPSAHLTAAAVFVERRRIESGAAGSRPRPRPRVPAGGSGNRPTRTGGTRRRIGGNQPDPEPSSRADKSRRRPRRGPTGNASTRRWIGGEQPPRQYPPYPPQHYPPMDRQGTNRRRCTRPGKRRPTSGHPRTVTALPISTILPVDTATALRAAGCCSCRGGGAPGRSGAPVQAGPGDRVAQEAAPVDADQPASGRPAGVDRPGAARGRRGRGDLLDRDHAAKGRASKTTSTIGLGRRWRYRDDKVVDDANPAANGNLASRWTSRAPEPGAA